MRMFVALLPLTVALAGCSSSDEPSRGTDVTINASGDDGDKMAIKADGKTGDVGINVPGFDAKVRLPKVLLKDADFDIDGVKMYPGATIKSVNVNADHGKSDSSKVQMTFEAPADTAKVTQWFKDQFAKKDIALTSDGNSLSGKTKDGDPFTIQLDAANSGKTSGTVTVTG